MNARRSSQLSLGVVLLCAASCSQSRPSAPLALSDALIAPGLGLGVTLGQPSLLRFDAAADSHVFGQASATAPTLPPGSRQVQVGAGTRLELGATRGVVHVLGAGSSAGVTLRPLDGPGGFASWGPGVASGNVVVYPSSDGQAAVVERASVTGVKEDLVLTRSLGDALRFTWQLDLGEGLEARLDADGSVGVYGTRIILGGDKTELRFRIPAPTIKAAAGETSGAAAHFELGPRTLTLAATGLDALAYPVSIDPSVVVTTAAELGLGGNFEGSADLDPTGRVKRAKTQVGLGAWTSSSNFTGARHSHSSVAANGFVYVLGGLAGTGNLNDVQFAPVNANGSLGTFTATSSFTTARSGHSSVVWNGYLYVIGGHGSTDLADVQVARLNADGTLGPFSPTSSFTTARQGHASVAWNGNLYVIGGRGSTDLADVQVAPINPNGTLGAFTTSTNSFSLPRSGHSAVAWNGFLYVLGGFSGSGTTSNIQVAPLDPNTGAVGSFTSTGFMSFPRGSHTSVTANGALYALGGATFEGSKYVSVEVGTLNRNGTLGTFTSTTPLPVARSGHTSVTWNGSIYVLGGSTSTEAYLNDVQVAPLNGNGDAQAFTTNTVVDSFTARGGHAAAAWNGRVYLLGGYNGANLAQVHVAPFGSNGYVGAFQATTSFANARNGHSSVAWNGFLYVIGGHDGTYRSDVQVAPINSDGSVGTWVPTTSLPQGRAYHASVAWNGYLYTLGGGSPGLRNDVLVAPINADGTLGTWTATTPFTNARAYLSSVAYGGSLYVIGGNNGGTRYGDVQVATINANGTLGGFSVLSSSLAQGRNQHTSLAANGFLYVLGGATDSATTASSEVQVAPINANGTLGAFTPTNSLAAARAKHASVTWNGYLYSFGGVDSSSPNVGYNDRQQAPLNGHRPPGIVTTNTNSFTPRVGHTSVAANGFLYVIGGTDGATPSSEVRFAQINPNGTVGPFSPTTSFATARSEHTSVVWNGRLYVIGGTTGATRLSDVQVAPLNPDGSVGTFTATSSFTTARSGHASVVWNGFLYVIGGTTGSALSDVQVAPINPDGSVGTFVATTSFTTARTGHGAVAWNGFLYVVGGTTGTAALGDVQAAPINANGTLGAFTPTASIPQARSRHTTVASDGLLYVVGGTDGVNAVDDVQIAPFNADGTLGNFVGALRFATPRFGHASATWNGFLYVLGGFTTTAAGDVRVVPLRTQAPQGGYSRLIDLGAKSTATSLTVNGAATQGVVRLDYRTASASGPLGAPISKGIIPLGVPVPLGGNGIRYVWLHFTLDDSLSAAINPDATNERDLTDLSLVYVPDPVLAPGTVTLPPKGSQAFVCTGGSGTGFVYALNPTNSGGSINASSGAYVAGATGNTVDTVTCTDSTGAAGTATVNITAGVAINPVSATLAPRQAQSFTPGGGSGSGYVFSFVTNNSGGTLTPAGAYQAGPVGSVVDTIRLTDSLSNTIDATVTVTPAVSIAPASASLPPRGTQTFTASGGSATGFTWSAVTNASGMSIDPATGLYTAGTVGGVTDVIGVTDSLGNTATRSITVTAGVTLSPVSATTSPRGTRTFVPSGGSGTGFTWSLPTDGSGATVVNGLYTAGPTGSSTDVVRVADSLGNFATATITVTAGVSATPASATVTPRGSASFSASGGSGTGFAWTFDSNLSGGAVTSGGAYTAGSTGSVTDVLEVTDSLGNIARVNVTVSSGITITPSTASTPPSGTIAFTAANGSGTGFTWSLVSQTSSGASITSGGRYQAGTQTGSDVIRVTDSLGNTKELTVTVTNALSISLSASVPPRSAQTLSGSGGSGTGLVWTLQTNNSGATLNATSGAYQAGPTGGVTDTVRLTDSLGNTTTATIAVTVGVSISPATTTVFPRGSQHLTPAGGSTSGFVWSFQTNASGGTVSTAGDYVAGTTGSVTDVVLVTDSLGNSSTASITVGPAVSIAPLTSAPKDTSVLSATGGSGAGFVWSFVTNASMGTLSAAGVYRAGAVGSVTDVVQVVDSLGNVAQQDLTVTAGVSISPSAPSVPPRGTLLLTATGGSGSGYSWFFTTNRSGATLSPTNGLYQAGPTADVVDELQVVDSLGNAATGVVNVTGQLAITPLLPTVAPRQALAFTAVNAAGAVTWRLTSFASGGNIDPTSGAYVAGATGGTTDTVQATDSIGNVASTTITVTAALSLTPGAVDLPPSGVQVFTAQGGAAAAYTFRIFPNLSGASFDPATGTYQAGARGGVEDTLEVSDSLGATATAKVRVGAGVSISPATASVTSGASQPFTASGGSGEGYLWSVETNASGGSIDPASGEYLAGELGNVTDRVQVTDSLGNTATAEVTVVARAGQSTRPVASLPPANGWSCGCSSSEGSGVLGLALLALLGSRRRRRVAVGAAVACLLVLAPLPADAAGAKKKSTPAKVTAPPPVAAPAPPPVVEAPKEVEPPPPPKAKGRPSVAVLDVEVTVPGEKLDGAAFSEMVLTAVDSANTFKVISAKEIATMLGIERQKQLLGCGEESSCMTEIANALGSDFLMVASVGRVGENYLVSTRLINGLTNKVTARASVQAKSANSLLEALWRATQQTLDGYGASLAPAEAQAWAARPKPTPPATLIAAEEVPMFFGVSAAATFGYQPLSDPGNRGSVGAEVDLTFRRGRLDLGAGVIVARSPGARLTATWALTDQRARVDVGLRGTLFPGLGLYGGGLTSGFEFGLTRNLGLNARVAVEAYPIQGTVVLALLGAAGVSARF